MSNVNHPKHYNLHPAGIECITIVEHYNFNLGTAIKYIWRAGLKSDNPLDDLEKAVWYVQREIQRLDGDNAIDAERYKMLSAAFTSGANLGPRDFAFMRQYEARNATTSRQEVPLRTSVVQEGIAKLFGHPVVKQVVHLTGCAIERSLTCDCQAKRTLEAGDFSVWVQQQLSK